MSTVGGDMLSSYYWHLSIKIGMSDRFAYSALPAVGWRSESRGPQGPRGVACESTPGVRQHAARQQRPDRAESKQGQGDTERSDVSACYY